VVTSDQVIAGWQYYADPYRCQACPDPVLMEMTVAGGTYSCSCISGYTLVGVSAVGNQSCVLSSLTAAFTAGEAAAAQVTFYDRDTKTADLTVTSLTFQHYYLNAAARCTYFGTPGDVRYCHQLANLCLMQMYDDESAACIAHNNIVSQRFNTFENVDNWVLGQPWLYVSGDPTATARFYSYKKRVSLNNQFVKLVLAAYTMNGTFVGFRNLETEFAYCQRRPSKTDIGGGTATSTDWQLFGANGKFSFECELESLVVETREQLFYELFLFSHKDYVSVFVRVVNTRSNGDFPNSLLTEEHFVDAEDVLTRRFFLFDKLTGITSASVGSNRPEVLRYASTISLEVSLREDFFAKIYPPILTIEYKHTRPAEWDAKPLADVDFAVNYTQNTDDFDTNFRIFFIVIMVLTGLLFAIRYRNWQKRNSRVVTSAVLTTDLGGFNMSTIIEMLLIATNTWVLVFFPVTVTIAWYFFTFFKIQSAPSVLLPPENNVFSPASPYYLFTANIHVMFFFQLWYVLMMIYRQCRADLFFIDWEPQPTKTKSGSGSGSGNGSGPVTANQVSVWRTILVANEWNEMQTLRKTDLRFTLFMLGFVLLGVNEEYNATHQPSLVDKSQGHLNVLLRFANTSFYLLLFSYGQFLWRFLVAERYLGEPPERLFVDFCTIAKISVIVLDEKYHGYYLHCRSPHQYADGTMTELVSMLHKEEAGLTVDRSLEGAPADVQTFQIFMSGEWRTAFDKIRDVLVGNESVAEVMNDSRQRALAKAGMSAGMGGAGNRGIGGSRGSVNGSSLNKIPSERILKAWKEMLVFLQEFVENNFGKAGLRRVVREPEYWEKLTLAAPELSVPDQPSVFFTDRDFNYCKVLFLGRELELLTLNILAYSIFDLWFGHTTTSMLLTYLLDLGLCFLRHYFGQAAISKKTLIDSRFLI